MSEPVEFRRVGPHTSPATTIQLPCDRCQGRDEPVVSIYAPPPDRRTEGYFPSRSFRLCGTCLRGALEILEVP